MSHLPLKLCHSAVVGFHRRELDSPACYHYYHYIDTVDSVTCAHAVSPTSIFWSVEHRAGILIQETERGSSRECSCPQFFYTDSFSFSTSLSLPLSPYSFLLLCTFSMKKTYHSHLSHFISWSAYPWSICSNLNPPDLHFITWLIWDLGNIARIYLICLHLVLWAVAYLVDTCADLVGGH